jgi:hypothetical protein
MIRSDLDSTTSVASVFEVANTLEIPNLASKWIALN